MGEVVQRCLPVAAVVGEEFDLDLVSEVADCDSPADAVDEAVRERVASRYRTTQEYPPPCPSGTDASGKTPRSSPSRHDAEVDLGLTKRRIVTRHDEVAGEGELAAASETSSMDRRDDGKGESFDSTSDRLALGAVLVGSGRPHRGHFTDIGSGGERALGGARYDHDPHLRVPLHVFESAGQRLENLSGEHVDRRMVQGEKGGSTPKFQVYEFSRALGGHRRDGAGPGYLCRAACGPSCVGWEARPAPRRIR